MAVQTFQVHVRRVQHVLDALERKVVAHRETELGVFAARANILMRVSLHARRDAHEDVLDHTVTAGDFGHAAKLNARVEHNTAHPCRNSLVKLFRRLVVAVHEHAVCRVAHG